MDDDHVEKVLVVIHKNRRLTVHEVAEEVGICCRNQKKHVRVAQM